MAAMASVRRPLPLVLVPGLLCTAELFGPQIRALGDVSAVSVADHTGHDSMADIAAGILARAPGRFALAGLSMGGAIALEMMRQAPVRIDRLALLDTKAGPDSGETAASRRRYMALARGGRSSEITRDHLHPARRDEKELVSLVIRMAEEMGPAAFLRQETALLRRTDMRPLLPGIRCPTLIVVGDADLITPRPEMAALVPGARLEVLRRCGHLFTLERPEETTLLLKRWLLA